MIRSCFSHKQSMQSTYFKSTRWMGLNLGLSPWWVEPNWVFFYGDHLTDSSEYCSVVMRLQYLIWTRPGIVFAVNQVCQFMYNSTTDNWISFVLKWFLCYIKGTANHDLLFQKYANLTLTWFSNANWAGSLDDRRSTSGQCVLLGNNLISWSAKKQHTVAKSSPLCSWNLMDSIYSQGLHLLMAHTLLIWYDNIGALFLASNPIFHAQMKHIKVIIIISEKRCCTKSWLFVLFPHIISWLTFL